ncbi:FMRFamide activated amiloride sensitive sodium [Echinococcus multilocularis]|uniref:FMRFamide activated amiloride sensitive sodium n=1 Tax=Echinococcus multilocularis TaxID=6211 RepID=A0A087VWH2_ECHMU|nr:FMRFamide activated amiloride sensitive sodium [Echinococcus multilocularis]
MVLWSGPDDNYGKKDRQAFLFDLFDQAYGLHVSIHEPGQMADLDRHSFQVAPGRMNELSFQTVQSVYYNRPTKPCLHEPKETFTDLEENFFYEFELCLNSHLQQQIVNKCGCLFAYYPRIHLPNESLPYCGEMIDRSMRLIDKEVVDRREQCAESLVNNAAFYRRVLEDDGTCLRRCVITDYESKVSVTKWRPTGWQLYWSQRTSSLFDAVVNGSLTPTEAKLIEHFLRTLDLDEVKGPTNSIIFDERYTYLMVKRKSNDTIIKEENLVLTVNALFSRIGGLCSLYIGLTLAVLMEIVEFIYLSWIKRKDDNDGTTKMPNEQDISARNPTKGNKVDKTGLEKNSDNKRSMELTDTLTVV